MILQELRKYYKRLCDEEEMFDFGFSLQRIGYSIALNFDGDVLYDRTRPLLDGEGKPQKMVSPYSNRAGSRSGSNPTSYFLVDNAKHAIGAEIQKGKIYPHQNRFDNYRKLAEEVLQGIDDRHVTAYLRFLEKWNPENSVKLRHWENIANYGNFGCVTFHVHAPKEVRNLHELDVFKKAWTKYITTREYDKSQTQEYAIGQCLITGQTGPLAPLCAKFQLPFSSDNAPIVSFNEKAYESYNKKKGENATIGLVSEFEASAALQHLIDSEQKVIIGRSSGKKNKNPVTTIVFWATESHPWEKGIDAVLDSWEIANDVKDFLQNCIKGVKAYPPEVDDSICFYILGLSPNKGRLTVRLWLVNTVQEIEEHLVQHLKDLEIDRGFTSNEPWIIGSRQILRETVPQKDSKPDESEVSSPLRTQLIRSVFTGQRYPMSLLYALLNRIRADRVVNATRAATIKAILNRNARCSPSGGKEIDMTLMEKCADPEYLAGRQFAVLERLQASAINARKPKNDTAKTFQAPKSTIRDQYFAVASTSPRATFVRLIKLSNHHLSTLKRHGGSAAYYQKLLGDIMDLLTEDWPKKLDVTQQSWFMVGYYHQLVDMRYKGNDSANQTDPENTTNE